MKPEKKVEVELTEEAQAVLNDLTEIGRMELAALKENAGLSNKKWDKSIKELTKNGLAKVDKTNDGLCTIGLDIIIKYKINLKEPKGSFLVPTKS